MKLFISSALMLLAASPFDSCGNKWSQKVAQDQVDQPPPLEYCKTDPPYGCGAACLTPDVAASAGDLPAGGAWLTPPCSEFWAGDLTTLFITDAQTILVCDTEAMGNKSYIVLPPYFLITPKVLQADDMCVPPPIPPQYVLVEEVVGQ